jgi:hypothetical protein
MCTQYGVPGKVKGAGIVRGTLLKMQQFNCAITRSSPGRHGIALFFDRNCSFVLAIPLKSGTIQANQN